MRAAHVPAITAPDLLPERDGVKYIPPGQSLTAANVKRLSSLVLNMIIESPFGP